MTPIAALQDYVEQHFVSMARLARLAGISAQAVLALIEARAIPGPIYALWPNGAFASPIGGHHGGEPAGEPAYWYASASAWWIRRAHGLTPAEAAHRFAANFSADFVTRLAAEPFGSLGYPHAYPDGRFDREAALATAAMEWRDWLDGGYGVCLRHADARHAITKTCRRAQVLAITQDGLAAVLSADERLALLDAMEELESVMLPFAPYQRPLGTPGLWLDAMLERYGMGTTPYAGQRIDPAPKRLCA